MLYYRLCYEIYRIAAGRTDRGLSEKVPLNFDFTGEKDLDIQ